MSLGTIYAGFNEKVFHDLENGGLGILENRLVKIKAPVLIIWGKHDRMFRVECADTFHKGIKNSRLVLLDSGHDPKIDAPEKTFAAYKDFPVSLK